MLRDHVYRPDIDGLRAVAVLAVIAYHVAPNRLPGGFVGVDVFFVISGFLITRLILDQLAADRFSFIRFYVARARRIFPALAVVLCAVMVAGWVLLYPADYMRLAKHVIGAALFIPNLLLWQDTGYFGPAAHAQPLLNLWSLGIEEQFYLAWPALLLMAWMAGGVRGVRALIIGAGLASFAACLAMRGSPEAMFYAPQSRAWELLIGATLAVWAVPRVLQTTGAALIALATLLAVLFLFTDQLLYPGYWALLPTLATAILIACGPAAWVNRSVLALPLATYIGRISYPLYLWHWPILWVTREAGYGERNAVIAGFAAALVLAALTYHFVERPIRGGASLKLSRGLRLASPLGAAALAALLIISVNGIPQRWPRNLMALTTYSLDQVREWRVGTCHLSPDQIEPARDCVPKRRPGHARIIIWGDSAAAALYPGLRDSVVGEDTGMLSASACPPFPPEYVTVPHRPRCGAANEKFREIIRRERPEVVILTAAPIYPDPDRLADHLRGTLKFLHTAGVARVIVAGPPPLWPRHLPTLILDTYYSYAAGHSGGNLSNTLEFDADRAAEIRRIDEQWAQVAAAEGAVFVSQWQNFCSGSRCLALIGDQPTACDDLHLSVAGSALIAQQLIAAMSQVGVIEVTERRVGQGGASR